MREITIVAVLTLVIAILIWGYASLDRKLTETRNQLWAAEYARKEAEKRLRDTENQVVKLVTATTPLIEKTDWMTGRWHGQFQTLVRLENARNEMVDKARRALMDIPLVNDFGKNLLASNVTLETLTELKRTDT